MVRITKVHGVRIRNIVIPAKAGIHWFLTVAKWIPAFAGMTLVLWKPSSILVPSSCSSVCIGNRQLFRRVQGNNLGSVWRENHFFLDARRGDAIACRAIGFHCEDHPGLELDRLLERVQARDERPLVQAETQAVAE